MHVPTISETYNKFQDEDGCPDLLSSKLDADSDGILDVLDSCPLIRENYNRFQDEDGCPDSIDSVDSTYTFPDTDADGIEDRWDSCIDEKENYNDFVDWMPNCNQKHLAAEF